MSGEPIPVRYPEGTTHGFLALRTLEGKLLASGELTEVFRGNQLVSHLVFRFKDGSVDDDTAVFSQRGTFRLISDHHIQKGPSFPHPTNVFINAATGQITVRYRDKDREKVKTDRLDLPPDLANGILLILLKNILPNTKATKVSYVGAAPKPRWLERNLRGGEGSRRYFNWSNLTREIRKPRQRSCPPDRKVAVGTAPVPSQTCKGL